MAATQAHRRSKMMGRRRHVDDEAEDHLDVPDIEDDSVTEGSVASDDHDIGADDSDSSNVDETSPTTPTQRKSQVATAIPALAATKSLDTALMLHEISVDGEGEMNEINYDDVASVAAEATAPDPRGGSAIKAPVIVSSDMGPPAETPSDRRRREHEEYKKRREEDPSLVPTRGFFFMHDQRQSGPPLRGYGRSRGRAGGRGGLAGLLAPTSQRVPNDPTTTGQWAHDLHDSVADAPTRHHAHAPPRHSSHSHAPPTGNGVIPTCAPNATPIDRTMSTDKTLGKVSVRVLLPAAGIEKPISFPNVIITQYTKLPDHRPPLRRDKAVRISLPETHPRFIFPADDRSFIFIPRAMRPNQQQRVRGKPQSRLGSIGGWSRRTSVFGGSYYGSAYSPSVAMSRRSSVAQDPRDLFSPTGSQVSRLPAGAGAEPKPVPVVRLPPSQHAPGPTSAPQGVATTTYGRITATTQSSINDLPPPQYPLPVKPAFQENHAPTAMATASTTTLPIHQPRPQKTVAVAGIEPSNLDQDGATQAANQAFQQAFHQQVPVSVSSALHDYSADHMHTRQSSYAASTHGHSTGTPLSQIPERAIHAAPFQPNAGAPAYGQEYAYPQHYGMMQPQQQPQGYYYPQSTPYGGAGSVGSAPSAIAPAFVPGVHPTQAPQAPVQSYGPASAPPQQPDMQSSGSMQPAGSSHVQQEYNGMVYYFDASQMPAMQPPPMNAYPPPPYGHPPQGYGPMPMQVGPPPDGFYYPQHGTAPGMVYYGQ
jgi:hypothetical protein